MGLPVLHLSASDFDAYLPERASTAAYAVARLESKQRLLAWSRAAQVVLGPHGLVLHVAAADEPATAAWVVFERPAATRRALEQSAPAPDGGASDPRTRHALLALRLDARGLAVGFVLHAEATLDRENARRGLDDPAAAPGLVEAVTDLPDEFAFGPGPGVAAEPPGPPVEPREACATATVASLRAAVADLGAAAPPLWIGWFLRREAMLDHAAILGDQLAGALGSLGPLHRRWAWSPDVDRVGLDLPREASRGAQAFDFSIPPTPSPPPVRVERGERREAPPIDKGCRVRVLAGPFADQVGVVAEVDGRGVRVLFGLLSTRAPLAEVEAVVEGRDRPSLQSSHRRAARPGAKLR